MKGLRKADEMEMSINLQAARLSWVYSSIFLLVWLGYDWIKMDSFNGTAFILMVSQLMVFWLIHLIMKWKLGKDEK